MSHDGRRRLERQSKAIAKQQAQDGALAFGLSIGGQSLPPTAAIGGAMEHYGLSCERPSIDTPVAGPVNRPGFVDSDDGANVRSAPAEMGGLVLTPIPPAARVFVSGRHPATPEWWYVTTIAQGEIVRGYVQRFRLAVDAPEPAAKLYQIQSGDTAERLASREFGAAVRDGLDLRFYEHVLLHVNRQQGRAGVRGTEGDVQLDAGRRIWLVSPEYALSLAGSVASGSLTGGLAAKARRGAGHLGDVLESVTSSPRHVRSVAGEVADALLEHLPEIVGITAGFIVAECASAFLAATPTGVGQLAAVMIQLGLAAFGANAAVEAGDQAMTHAEQWLTLAWTANGDRRLLDEGKPRVCPHACVYRIRCDGAVWHQRQLGARPCRSLSGSCRLGWALWLSLEQALCRPRPSPHLPPAAVHLLVELLVWRVGTRWPRVAKGGGAAVETIAVDVGEESAMSVTS